MSRELDAEIAELLGWEHRGVHWIDPEGLYQKHCAEYSSDLNALLALIRRRWPHAHIVLSCEYAAFFKSRSNTTEYPFRSSDGDTDTKRLANAVAAALRAEKEKE